MPGFASRAPCRQPGAAVYAIGQDAVSPVAVPVRAQRLA